MIIGLTGRVGSGKSYIASILEHQFDLEIIDLDILGHQLLEKDSIKDGLFRLFGESIFTPDFRINRAVLGKIVFSSAQQLQKLNKLIHPALTKEAILMIESLEETEKIGLVVGALIQELGLESYCDDIIVVDASDEAIRKRIGAKFDISRLQKNREDYLKLGHRLENDFTPDTKESAIHMFQNLTQTL